VALLCLVRIPAIPDCSQSPPSFQKETKKC
jgi:hypothetical protein